MPRCHACPRSLNCRVPGELARFGEVAHRLATQRRNPLLQQRLHYYMEHPGCLVEAGMVEL